MRQDAPQGQGILELEAGPRRTSEAGCEQKEAISGFAVMRSNQQATATCVQSAREVEELPGRERAGAFRRPDSGLAAYHSPNSPGNTLTSTGLTVNWTFLSNYPREPPRVYGPARTTGSTSEHRAPQPGRLMTVAR